MQQLTIEWIDQKLGMLYRINCQMQDDINALQIENAELKRQIELKPKEDKNVAMS